MNKRKSMKALNKLGLVIVAVTLAGCASSPDTEKSVSRDATMTRMAETALIAEMLNSPDPVVRAKGAEIADKFINRKEKKSIFNF